MRAALSCLLGFALLTTSLQVRAQAESLYARTLAATCAQCHGTDGRSQAGMARLAGQPRQEIVRKLKAYQAGTLPSTVMGQLARGYSDAQLEQLAAYFAAQK